MEIMGTKFTIAIGELRLRFLLALEDADDDVERASRDHTIHVRR